MEQISLDANILIGEYQKEFSRLQNELMLAKAMLVQLRQEQENQGQEEIDVEQAKG